MFKKSKKFIALALSLCILFSMVSVGLTAVALSGDVQVKSITATTRSPITYIENTGGYDADGYYHYDLTISSIVVTVTLQDGTVLTNVDEYGCPDWFIEYNGEMYDIDISDNQSEENPWLAGNTYEKTVSVLGASCTVPVTIVENPVKSITATPITLIENADGGDWGDYYHYSASGDDTIVTVTLQDGTVLSNADEWGYINWYIEYNDEWYDIDIALNQDAENPLLAGNTYEATVSVMGASCTVPVTIVENPVKSITATPITIIENTGGWDNGDYYEYDIDGYDTVVTVTLQDGTVLTNMYEWGDKSSDIEYNGKSYYIDFFLDQSEENPLLAGNTYEATLSVLGASCTVPVTIVESPVKSITATPITIIENTGGWDNGDYYEYDIDGYDTVVTVTLQDGTVLTNMYEGGYKSSSIEYNGRSYYIDFSLDQSEENPWTAGNTYEATLTVMGKSCTVPVTITESPVESLEILEVEPLYVNDYEYIDDGLPYYDVPSFTLRINFKNGESIIYKHDTSFFDGSLNIECSYDHYFAQGKDNIVTVSCSNVSTQFNVVLLDPKSEYEYIVQDGEVYITACRSMEENLIIPSKIDGMDVKGIVSLHPAKGVFKQVTVPDTVTYISSDAFYDWESQLEVVNLGAGIEEINFNLIGEIKSIKEVNISPDNKNYASYDGVLYNKALDTLVYYPYAKGNTYYVPATVTDVSLFNYEFYSKINVVFEEGNEIYVTVDGITYTKDVKTVVSCNPEKTGEYIMPESVTSISDYAFTNSNLTKVTVSSSVTKIAYGAFSGCQSLNTVVLPDNLKVIDEQAFAYSSINQIDLPESLEKIGGSSFYNTKLTKIEIPGSVKTISDNAFAENYNLSEIVIGEGTLEIGSSAFYRVGGSVTNTTIHLPNSLVSIGSSAFRKANISEITIPDSVVTLGECAFYESNLKNVVIGNGISYIPSDCFGSCASLKTVKIMGKNVEVGNFAFDGSPIENLNLDSIGKIGYWAFKDHKMTSLIFPDNVTEIAYEVFSGENLTEIVLPKTIEKVGQAFTDTPWWENQPENEWIYLDPVLYNYKGDRASAAAPNIPEGITVLADYSMARTTFDSVKLPNSLKTIGDNAFLYNKNITSLYIPENVKLIGERAFEGCTSLSNIEVDKDNPYFTSVDGALYSKDMSELIFCFAKNGDTFRIPDTVTKIRNYAFDTATFKYVIIENDSLELSKYSLLQTRDIDGIKVYYTLPTIVCNTTEDSKVYKFAKENLHLVEDKAELVVDDIKLIVDEVKTEYKINEVLDIEGLKLKATYKNGVTECIDVTADMVSGFDSSTAGVKTLTVDYQGHTATFDITVESSVTVASKMVRPGETFDLIVSLDSSVVCSSMAISNITYDNTKIQLIGAEWLADGLIIKNWDSVKLLGVGAFAGSANSSGNLVKLTFKVNDTVEDATFDVGCDFAVKLDDINVPISVNAGTVKIVNVLPGDLNGDEKVTDKDAVYLLYHTFFADEYPLNQDCDFNGDGKVTDADAVYLLNYTFFPNEYPLH